MNYFDIIIIIPLLWGAFKGFKKGLIIELASLIALFLGVWGAIKFSSVVGNYLDQTFTVSEKFLPLVSFAVTFILIVIAVYSLAKLLEKLIKAVALGFVNKLAGLAFGLLKVTLIVSIGLYIVDKLNHKFGFVEQQQLDDSLLYEPVKNVAPVVLPVLDELTEPDSLSLPV
ncbi:MAG TPA: colicin V production protein [Flavobacteriales bacterium]|nr:colicin V production protein [Flavobacteriales bacterium]|tara:strand:- start:95825 stop:96337 length:513 start_codon:yes stop_codon:yes gene_type:complete